MTGSFSRLSDPGPLPSRPAKRCEPACGGKRRWRRKYQSAWLLAFVAGISHCGGPQVPNAAPASVEVRREEQKPVRGLLWELRHGAGKAHVLGVLPSAAPEAFSLDPRIERAFLAAEVLALEVWVPPLEHAEAAEALVQAGRYTEGGSLGESLSPVALELLAQAVPSQAERAVLDGFRPWFVALTLRMAEVEGLGALEPHFLERAEGKRVVGLVPRELPVQLLSSLSPELAEEELVHTLRELPSLRARLEEAARAWRRGQLELAAEALGDPQASQRSPALVAALVTKKRRAIAEGLLRLLGEPASAFVLLELSELSGPGSVLELLEQAQVSVRRL